MILKRSEKNSVLSNPLTPPSSQWGEGKGEGAHPYQKKFHKKGD